MRFLIRTGTVWNSDVVDSLHLDLSAVPALYMHRMFCEFLGALTFWHNSLRMRRLGRRGRWGGGGGGGGITAA
jgi:hypothetical protein